MKVLETKMGKTIWYTMVRICPSLCIRIMYNHILHRKINLKNPQDLNEKINYLKLYENNSEWSELADKYAVRRYVEERGLKDILIPIYGKYSNAEELLNDWEHFPKKFIIKTNNGCGTIYIVKDKDTINKEALKRKLSYWLIKKDIGIGTIELHYTKIKPLLIVEELLEDKDVQQYSRSLVDYKIWCFDGKPFCCLVAFDRELSGKGHHVVIDTYDINWTQISETMTDNTPKRKLPCPKNWELMLSYARILSKGHKQVRVDLYNIEGKVFFGEMTFTSQGGYMDYYTPDFLKIMGNQFDVK